MRTAITLGLKGKEWVVIHGPDIPADRQRYDFANIGGKWPKDFTEVRFQLNDAAAKTKNKAKAETSAEQMANAGKRVEEKEKLAAERQAKEKAEAEKAQAAAKAAADSARQAELKAKEDAKRPTFQPPKKATV